MNSKRWIFWVYLALAIPTLLAIFVFKVEGDANGWMWLFGILMLILSMPWVFYILGTPSALPLIGVAILANVFLLWFATRKKVDTSP